jgi:hypothetical protein
MASCGAKTPALVLDNMLLVWGCELGVHDARRNGCGLRTAVENLKLKARQTDTGVSYILEGSLGVCDRTSAPEVAVTPSQCFLSQRMHHGGHICLSDGQHTVCLANLLRSLRSEACCVASAPCHGLKVCCATL